MIPRLIEKKEIGVANEKERGADAIKEPRGNKQREKTHRGPMDVKSVARPEMDPGKSVIFE